MVHFILNIAKRFFKVLKILCFFMKYKKRTPLFYHYIIRDKKEGLILFVFVDHHT
ncbi:hypothetical protein PHEL49_2238 [Polaribacter sp. Hel1_33_49]|nr:hypothetical protein PHEL49_2238 [Polaribacter sp. Hel1_33_49]